MSYSHDNDIQRSSKLRARTVMFSACSSQAALASWRLVQTHVTSMTQTTKSRLIVKNLAIGRGCSNVWRKITIPIMTHDHQIIFSRQSGRIFGIHRAQKLAFLADRNDRHLEIHPPKMASLEFPVTYHQIIFQESDLQTAVDDFFWAVKVHVGIVRGIFVFTPQNGSKCMISIVSLYHWTMGHPLNWYSNFWANLVEAIVFWNESINLRSLRHGNTPP